MMWRIAMIGGLMAAGGCASSHVAMDGVSNEGANGGQLATTSTEGTTTTVASTARETLPGGPYAYVYYPEIEAYFSPDRNRWFWVDPQEGWRFDTELPADMKLRAGSGVQLHLDCEHPNDRHAQVQMAYPASGSQRESTHAGADN